MSTIDWGEFQGSSGDWQKFRFEAAGDSIAGEITELLRQRHGISETMADDFTVRTQAQEMLGKGFLAGNSVYVCTEHTPAVLDAYFEALDPIFATIKQCEEGRDVMGLLKGPVCHGGFKRLN